MQAYERVPVPIAVWFAVEEVEAQRASVTPPH